MLGSTQMNGAEVSFLCLIVFDGIAISMNLQQYGHTQLILNA